MKLKQQPQDFVVEEIAAFTPDPQGRYFVYTLTKRGITTLEVLAQLRRRLRLSQDDVAASGLKDKRAIASQLVSLARPIPGDFAHPDFSLRFAGKSSRPMSPAVIVANRFDITARGMNADEVARAVATLPLLMRHGVPNYYDSQRFGGGARHGELPGRCIVRGDYAEALRLFIAVPRRKQSMWDKRIRRTCAKFWGDWARIADKLPACPERRCIARLCQNPDDVIGALAQIDRAQLRLSLAAYQSLLFNHVLNLVVHECVPESLRVEVPFKGGALWMWRELDDASACVLRELRMTSPAFDTNPAQWSPIAGQALVAVLAREGVELAQVRAPELFGVTVKDHARSALLCPTEMVMHEAEPDDLNAGALKLRVQFTLPSGSYATLIMKRLAHA